jgi:predicted metalloprotease
MRWRTGRRSENVEDRRGDDLSGRLGGGFPGAGGFRFPTGGGMGRRGGIGGIGLVLLVIASLYLGVDPSVLLEGGSTQVPTSPSDAGRSLGGKPAGPLSQDEATQFVAVVLGDTEDTWNEIFRGLGRDYREPRLVLFSGAVDSACGFAQAAVGPFYCPADQKVYIDLAFYEDLRSRFQAPGDFAQAYVIAHEVGHHVQNLLGVSQRVQSARARAGEEESNALSVLLELQADCFAGVWAYHANAARQLLEQGDVEEGLTAASAIGDDRLQRQAGRYVTPESFTHGSSAQRVRWFRRGLERGELEDCDTFATESP